MFNFLRRWWGKSFVEITRRIGEDEVLKFTFNERNSVTAIQRTDEILTFLNKRRDDHNRAVLQAVERSQKRG